MQITVDHTLIARLIECIDHQATIGDQDEETQKRWQAVISSTVSDAMRYLPRTQAGVDDRKEVGEGARITSSRTNYL